MLMHLAIDEEEIRIDRANRVCKIADCYRISGLLAAPIEVPQPFESAAIGVRPQELLVSTRSELQESESVIFDCLADL